MAGVNTAILIGRLGKDPEIKDINGKTVCNFSIATSEEWKDKQTGEKKERTEWHNIQAWDKLADICSKYLTKGMQVYIEGSLQTRKYTKDGQDHYVTSIRANSMQMLGSKGQNVSHETIPTAETVPDDEIPF